MRRLLSSIRRRTYGDRDAQPQREVFCVISERELERARRDPGVQAFARMSRGYAQRAREHGLTLTDERKPTA